jgi:opacity protein-like surface antigen
MRNACLVALAVMLPAVVSAQQPTPTTPTPAAQTSSPAPARDHKGFVAVHFGGQANSSHLTDTFTFNVYDEVATVSDNQEYGGGVLVNFEGGYAFHPRLAVGLAISHSSGDTDARVDASIPHPQVFDQRRQATFDVPDTNHSEIGYHFFVAYQQPVNDKLGIRVFAGPSILSVKHDLVSAIQFTETAPFTTVTITSATVTELKETAGAFHVGAGATYNVTDMIGVDGFFRFARATVDVSGVSGGNAEVRIGGAQFGIGVRVGF